MINAIRQVREQDPDIPIIGGNTMDNELVWKALGAGSKHIYFPGPYIDTEVNLYKKASARFLEKFGHEINWCNIYGFTTANYLVKAFKHTYGDKAALRKFMENLNENSLRGNLRMTDNGDVDVNIVVRTRENGRTVNMSNQN
jgi:ABC-type branched-subunit amino acid transport system substrate-binding protein